jgi:hypothetical protein
MTNSIATTTGHVKSEEMISSQVASNPLANIWLVFLALILVSTLFCTAVLMAWPIIAQMAAG